MRIQSRNTEINVHMLQCTLLARLCTWDDLSKFNDKEKSCVERWKEANSIESVYVGKYCGLSESGLCVFGKLCPIGFLEFCKCLSVWL